jgi:hypothetical protein
MSPEPKRLSNNMAGIEFAACLENIKELLQKNWKHAQIYRHLKEEGKITMSYGSLCYHMRRLSLDRLRPSEEPPPTPRTPPLKPPAPRPATGPRHVSPTSGKFPDPRDMNPDEAL